MEKETEKVKVFLRYRNRNVKVSFILKVKWVHWTVWFFAILSLIYKYNGAAMITGQYLAEIVSR